MLDIDSGLDDGLVMLEIHIVKLALLGGTYGLQFKRIRGDNAHYKSLSALIIDSLSL